MYCSVLCPVCVIIRNACNMYIRYISILIDPGSYVFEYCGMLLITYYVTTERCNHVTILYAVYVYVYCVYVISYPGMELNSYT